MKTAYRNLLLPEQHGIKVPTRVYVEKDCLSARAQFGSVWRAMDYLVDVVNSHDEINPDKHRFLMGIAWTDGKTRNVDIFGWNDVEKWPGNSEVDIWTFENRMYKRKPICEDGSLLVGLETLTRRESKNWEHFIGSEPPRLVRGQPEREGRPIEYRIHCLHQKRRRAQTRGTIEPIGEHIPRGHPDWVPEEPILSRLNM